MESGTPHALFLPYPSQGHINPMVRFAKRLATTRIVLSSTRPELGPVALASISDGFDRAGSAEAGSGPAYHDHFESVGSTTLDELIRSERFDPSGHIGPGFAYFEKGQLNGTNQIDL